MKTVASATKITLSTQNRKEKKKKIFRRRSGSFKGRNWGYQIFYKNEIK